MTLDGQTALITGAARGIGLAIAERLARDGATVALVDRDRAAVEAAATRVGGSALAIVADVTLTADVERAVAIPREKWGRLDIVVNNAGWSHYPGASAQRLLPVSRGAQSISHFDNATSVIAAGAPGVRLRRHAV